MINIPFSVVYELRNYQANMPELFIDIFFLLCDIHQKEVYTYWVATCANRKLLIL
jgi:hypothetical protein